MTILHIFVLTFRSEERSTYLKVSPDICRKNYSDGRLINGFLHFLRVSVNKTHHNTLHDGEILHICDGTVDYEEQSSYLKVSAII